MRLYRFPTNIRYGLASSSCRTQLHPSQAYPQQQSVPLDMFTTKFFFIFVLSLLVLPHLTKAEHSMREQGLLEQPHTHGNLMLEVQNGTHQLTSSMSNSWTDAIPGNVSADGVSEPNMTDITPNDQIDFLLNPTSLKGYNRMYYKGYVFNEEFAVKFCPEADTQAYERVRADLRFLSIDARHNNLTTKGFSKWYPVAQALWWSFYNENGTLAYVNNTSYEGWIFCGCVNLKSTFVNESNYFRMCAPTTSVGLKTISRAPIEGYDYLVEKDGTFSQSNYFDYTMRKSNHSNQRPAKRSQRIYSSTSVLRTLPEYDFATASDGSLDGECKFKSCFSQIELFSMARVWINIHAREPSFLMLLTCPFYFDYFCFGSRYTGYGDCYYVCCGTSFTTNFCSTDSSGCISGI